MMGFNPTEIFTRPLDDLTDAAGLPLLPRPPFIDPLDAITDPGGTGQQIIDIFRDPLADLEGLPGIAGNEAEDDGGQLEVARQEKAQDTKTKALLAKRKREGETPNLTGPQNLASDDTANIATRTLLG